MQFVYRLILLFLACSNLCFASQNQPQYARIFLLGEIHDNPNAHSLRLDFVNKLISENEKPIVAMEQFDRETQQTLDVALSTCKDVSCVLKTSSTPGWNWRFYEPYVQLALDKKITLIAANLSNSDVRKVINNGFSAVYSPVYIADYELNQIPSLIVRAQEKSIQDGHCNMLPAQAIGPMAQGQIARDVWMANIINSFQDQTVILIAGNGHIRKDAGVFYWLSQKNKLQAQVHGYVEQIDNNYSTWFDYIHEVAQFVREDQCVLFQKHINNK